MAQTASEAPPRRPTPVRRWRALPFTAQLLVIGMLVGLAWFLAARAAAERQQEAALARNADLVRLQRAELHASQLGASLQAMSRSHRGFLLTGESRFLAVFRLDSLAFERDAARLLEIADGRRTATDLDDLRDALRLWHDTAMLPNVERRRTSGLSAFEPGTPGAEGIARSTALMDAALELQERLLDGLRGDVQLVELLVDEAATRDDLSTFLTSTGGLAVLILLLFLLMRLVRRALDQVVQAALALDAGHYADARLPESGTAPNREMALLASTFEQLAATTAKREQQLQDDIVELRDLERLKRDFVSTVSHELRTPLTSMRGALGLILGGKVGELPARASDLLRIAMTNTERLIRLINDILDIEKIDAGHAIVRRDPLRLRPLLETTIAGVESFAREQGVAVTMSTGPEADADLVGDADRLIQVFTNLLSNAVKFSPPGAAVDVSVTLDGEQAVVRVRDRGPGIPTAFAGRIFGKFQQAGGADSRQSGGTGLGLNIARAIVESHAGRIGFEPAPDGGTVFWVALPRELRAVAGGSPESRPDVRRAVLVVEDDPSMRGVLVALVDPIARAVAVHSAEAALEVLAREPIAAIILDAGLPGMDGFALARQVRQDPRLRTMPVFLFSAREFPAEVLRQAGIRAADAYVKTRDSESVLFERLRHQLAKAP
jgi:signal transduction histidine kinase/CheY-like chemotaxis protein